MENNDAYNQNNNNLSIQNNTSSNPPYSDNRANRPKRPDNYLIWSIVSTAFCCFPLGIIAIIYSAKVDKLYNDGEYQDAEHAANKAKTLSIISAIVAVVIAIVIIILNVFLIAIPLVPNILFFLK